MIARYRGLQLQSGSPAYPVLKIAFDWMEEQNGPIRKQAANLLLHRLRQAGFCFCETMYGCVACKGEHNMPRNEFEQNIPVDDEEKEVPLTLGVGGPVIGTARVTKNGVVIGEITDDNLRKKLQGDLSAFSIGRDPADRYRVDSEEPITPASLMRRPRYRDLRGE